MTKLIHYIIVEDVERQREYLKSWLKKTRPNLNYVADFSNHLDAYLFLLSKDAPSVNMIFLDIELPGKRDGLNLLELLHGKLKQPPKVIIISGNDYLLDPFEQIYLNVASNLPFLLAQATGTNSMGFERPNRFK